MLYYHKQIKMTRSTGVAALILSAWLTLALIGASPYTGRFSHHVIGERGLSPILSLGLFMSGWLLMSVAMMLPGVLPTLARLRRFGGYWTTGYLAVWLEFGLLVYAGDFTLHTWLEPRFPLALVWLPATLLLTAGLYQLTPWKRRYLAGCGKELGRHRTALDALASGWRYGLTCAGSCWALMLVMAALGSMSLAWMGVLSALMVAEKSPRRRRDLTFFTGTVLLGTAGVTALRAVGVG